MSYIDRVGMEIKSDHPNAFKSGFWGRIVAHDITREGRQIWLIAWPDGSTDTWPCEDNDASYQFRQAVKR